MPAVMSVLWLDPCQGAWNGYRNELPIFLQFRVGTKRCHGVSTYFTDDNVRPGGCPPDMPSIELPLTAAPIPWRAVDMEAQPCHLFLAGS